MWQVKAFYDGWMYRQFEQELYGDSGFFNYGYWDESTRNQPQACEQLMQRLLGLSHRAGGRWLDVACGMGGTTRYVARNLAVEEVVGTNLSAKQIDSCRALLPECRFEVMPAEALDFPDASFDAVICVEAAFHFNTRRKFLQEAFRVLKPGGTLYMTDMLVSMKREAESPFRVVENFVADLPAYEKLLRSVGFCEATLVDATQQCWGGHYRHHERVRVQMHDEGRLDEKTFDALSKMMVRLDQEIGTYLLGAAQKRAT